MMNFIIHNNLTKEAILNNQTMIDKIKSEWLERVKPAHHFFKALELKQEKSLTVNDLIGLQIADIDKVQKDVNFDLIEPAIIEQLLKNVSNENIDAIVKVSLLFLQGFYYIKRTNVKNKNTKKAVAAYCDALHLSQALECDYLYTLDKGLVESGNKLIAFFNRFDIPLKKGFVMNLKEVCLCEEVQ